MRRLGGLGEGPPGFFVASGATLVLSILLGGQSTRNMTLQHQCNVFHLESSGTTLGLLESSQFASKAFQLEKGDVFVAYTDGITESENHCGELWGQQRLENLLRACRDCTPAQLVERILDEILAFGKDCSQMVGTWGLEPQTSTVSRKRSNQLSYGPLSCDEIAATNSKHFHETSHHAPVSKSAYSVLNNLQAVQGCHNPLKSVIDRRKSGTNAERDSASDGLESSPTRPDVFLSSATSPNRTSTTLITGRRRRSRSLVRFGLETREPFFHRITPPLLLTLQ
jgi:hypothetical protein